MNNLKLHDDKHDKHDSHAAKPKDAVSAIFQSREEARQALHALHKAHFKKSWFGVTSVAKNSHGEETLTAEQATGTFFSQNAVGLIDALVAHGIEGDVARRIEATIEAGEAIVTVETENRDPIEAVEILERFGGMTEVAKNGRAADVSRTSANTAPIDSVYDDDTVEMPVWEEDVFYSRTPLSRR